MTPSPPAADERALFVAVLGQVIRALRTSASRMSQETLAIRAGLSTSALSRFETGQTAPDLYELRRVSSALGTSPAAVCRIVEESFDRARVIAQKTSAGRSPSAIAGLAVLAVSGLVGLADLRRQ